MPPTLPIDRLQTILASLGHYGGKIDGIAGPKTDRAIRDFQRHNGLSIDGVVGPRTMARLDRRSELLARRPAECATASLYPFRLTEYHLAVQTAAGRVRLTDVDGRVIALVTADFFARAALEGTARLSDGQVVNVTGRYTPANDRGYGDLDRWYKRYVEGQNARGKVPKPPAYFGIGASASTGEMLKVMTFRVLKGGDVGIGYGVEKDRMPKVPWKTLAADLGLTMRCDPQFRGHGGLVPIGSKVWIGDFVGLEIPAMGPAREKGGTGSDAPRNPEDRGTAPPPHDGWFTVNDCGGGIFGLHFDVFTGDEQPSARFAGFPERAYAWYDGAERKIQVGYDLGLYDE